MRSRARKRGEGGTSSIELVLYMPLLVIAIFLTVQFALIYLGNQAVSASAREAARTARVTGDAGQGEARGRQYADDLGRGLLSGVDVRVDLVNGDNDVRAVVTARGQQLFPFFPAPRLSEEVQGPVEQFIEDQ